MKLALGLVPGFFIRALAVPFMLGEAKYARGDWAKQEDPEKFVEDRTDSLIRHMAEYQDGIEYDSEGPHHLAAVAWNALVILYYKHFRIPGNVQIYHDSAFRGTLAKYLVTSITEAKDQVNVGSTVEAFLCSKCGVPFPANLVHRCTK